MDGQARNKSFAESIGVNFPLLCDVEKKVCRQYGVLNRLLRLASRTTFVVDKQGIIRRIDKGWAALDPNNAYEACTIGRRAQNT